MRQQRFIKNLCSLGMFCLLAVSHPLWALAGTKPKAKPTAPSTPATTIRKSTPSPSSKPSTNAKPSKSPGTKLPARGHKKPMHPASETLPPASAEAPPLGQPACEDEEPTTEALTKPTVACEQDSQAIVLTHYALHETYCLRPSKGPVPFSCQQQQALKHELRCHHTQQQGPLDPNLVQLFYNAVTNMPNTGAKPAHVTVIAGYRAPDVAKSKGNPNSAHTQGRAIDFLIEGVNALTLFDWIRGHLTDIEWTHEKHPGIEVIYYPNQDRAFVHLAIHRDNTNWIKIDDSRPGEDMPQRDPPPLPVAMSKTLAAAATP